jgi:trk system potassium uptake protein TrkH
MVFKNQYSMSRAIFLSVFHAISFFCNAGITLFNNSLALYAGNYSVLLTASLLMLLGGIGFLTIYEVAHLMGFINIEKRKFFSLQSKIIIYGTLITVSVSTILIFLLEYNNAFAAMSTPGTLVNSFFHAVSFRSAGLLAVPVSSLQLATIFLIMIISFIGSAPGSTGSGIRITTLAIYLAVIKAAITSHMNVNLKGRRVAKDQINKAIAIISLAIFWIATTTFFLLISERSWEFIDIFFEAVCAFTNLGLTTGITLALTVLGKLFIMVSMIVGRIGSLTLILALKKIASRKGTEGAELVYPEERIMLS